MEERRRGEGKADNGDRSGDDEEVNHVNRKCHNKVIVTWKLGNVKDDGVLVMMLLMWLCFW